MMKHGTVYRQRLPYLRALPACFDVRELRLISGLSGDAAWQTCRYWLDEQRVIRIDRGFYHRVGEAIRLPVAWHRALAGDVTGYFTGRSCLAHWKVGRHDGTALDVVSGDRVPCELEWQGCRIRYHRVRHAECPVGLVDEADGGRTFRIASPERVILDGLLYPGRFLDMRDLVEIMRRYRRHFHQATLIDLVSAMGEETAWRRLRVVAGHLGLKHLSRWLAQGPSPNPRMGPILLDPTAQVPAESVFRSGVIDNLGLADSTG